MTQMHTAPNETLVDREIRDSVRVIHRQRNTKLAVVILIAVLGIFVLFLGAYLGFGGG